MATISAKVVKRGNQIESVSSGLRDDMTRLVVVHNQLIGQKADADCPIASGFLRSSRVESYENDGMTGKQTYTADYAKWVHDGTSKMVGRPWLAQAAADASKEFKHALTVRLRTGAMTA